jgi:hypothetical protein
MARLHRGAWRRNRPVAARGAGGIHRHASGDKLAVTATGCVDPLCSAPGDGLGSLFTSHNVAAPNRLSASGCAPLSGQAQRGASIRSAEASWRSAQALIFALISSDRVAGRPLPRLSCSTLFDLSPLNREIRLDMVTCSLRRLAIDKPGGVDVDVWKDVP